MFKKSFLLDDILNLNYSIVQNFKFGLNIIFNNLIIAPCIVEATSNKIGFNYQFNFYIKLQIFFNEKEATNYMLGGLISS